MGFVPPRLIRPMPVGELQSDFERFAAALRQLANASYHLSDFTPVPELVSDHTVVNEQGMQLPLPVPQEWNEQDE